ncbi:hypothetical protein TPER_HE00460 [Candidatus Hoaglandella endobia]|uniref:Uncharacterized protein n=1 Tax=Candidatus Hoaglandella endobia TaxID=1778263 RepID=A0A143WUE4_9ENTR|nr:hypothetical protein TPER_HE00460 [Candidatus Hoaglandella endobia]
MKTTARHEQFEKKEFNQVLAKLILLILIKTHLQSSFIFLIKIKIIYFITTMEVMERNKGCSNKYNFYRLKTTSFFYYLY